LKYYVEEMGSIKKLLEEYQTDNNRLKVENNELYEDGEIARVNLDKMEAKYDECMEREENLLNDLQSYMAEVNMLKDRLAQANAQLDQIEAAYAALRKEADEEKLNAKRLAEKLEVGERNL
jgi:archaellum component FlaC